MEKKKIFVLAGTGLLGITTLGLVVGLKYFSGTTSQASIDENPPSSIRLAEVSPTSATITWTTSKEAYGFVSYGETMSLGKTVQTEGKTPPHSVTLEPLLPGTTYHYKIGVGEQVSEDTYSFTTPKSDAAATAEEPTVTEEPPIGMDTAVTEDNLKKAIGTDNPKFDLNGDGTVNAIDLMILRKRGQ